MDLNLENSRPFALNHISVDCVVLGFDGERLNVLLSKREDMGLHDMKLPGSLIYADETPDEAAARVIADFTGMSGLKLEQFRTFGSLERTSNPEDVRWLEMVQHETVTRIITVAYFTILRTDRIDSKLKNNKEVVWVSVDALPHLAFDHNEIISSAVDCFARMTYFNHEYLFKLLPRKFTITQLRKLYEIVLRTKMDPGNFYKKVALMPYVVPLEEKQLGGRHRAARYYKYDNKAYKKGKL